MISKYRKHFQRLTKLTQAPGAVIRRTGVTTVDYMIPFLFFDLTKNMSTNVKILCSDKHEPMDRFLKTFVVCIIFNPCRWFLSKKYNNIKESSTKRSTAVAPLQLFLSLVSRVRITKPNMIPGQVTLN